MGAMVMVHPTRITAYGSNTRVCREIAIALTMRVQLPSGRQTGSDLLLKDRPSRPRGNSLRHRSKLGRRQIVAHSSAFRRVHLL